MQGKLLEPGRQRREEYAGAAEERAEREARRKQTLVFEEGQPLKQAEQEHVSGKTGSNALQGGTVTHVHTAEAQGDQKDSRCSILVPQMNIKYGWRIEVLFLFSSSSTTPCQLQFAMSGVMVDYSPLTSKCTTKVFASVTVALCHALT